jgi:uncharacterized protein (DUF1778 family)
MSSQRTRSERLEVRTTPEDRVLIDRAVDAVGSSLSDFVVSNLTEAAHRTLADRALFELDDTALAAWTEVNSGPAIVVEGLKDLIAGPSPFSS